MAEIWSELKSVLIENDDLNQNPGEFKRFVVEKQVFAGHQGDFNGDDDNQDEQRTQCGGHNALLVSQENKGPSTPVMISDDHVAGDGEVLREKPILMVTNEIRPRLRWTYELHEYFLEAVDRLGGPRKAKPKAILDLMDLDGLNLYHIKSHLQKFRLGKFSVKDWQDTSKNGIISVSQLRGGSLSLRPLSSVESQTTKITKTTGDSRGPIAKGGRKSKKERRGQRKLQDRYLRYMDAQKHLNTTLTDRRSGGVAMENAFLSGQPSAGLGTFTRMPAPSVFGMVAALLQFDFNQQNLCPAYDAPTGQANVSIEEVPFGYRPQTSLYPAPEGFSTPKGYPASSNEESLPALPSSEVEMMIQPGDEDFIEALLNWDDEPINLSSNYDDIRDCLS